MLTERDIVARIDRLTVTRFRVWVRQGWIKPADQVAQGYSEADTARAWLIRDLEDELGFDEEVVPVLLHLIDQIHGLRSELKVLLEAFDALPGELRERLKAEIADRKRSGA
jgi:chaperone modulatory protein CbpM